MSYWNKALGARLTRRRAMVSAGTASAAAAILAACGSGGSSKKDAEIKKLIDKSGLTAEAVDTTAQAKRGGTLKRNVVADPPSLDPMNNYTQLVPFYETVYGRLVSFKPGHLGPASEDAIDGDLCDQWEFSPDRLQITLKMRPGVTWHNIPPISGRAVDVDDVLYTWKRFSTIGNQRTGLANIANPDAPVLSVTAPDKQTIVIKLKDPVVYALSMFGARENVNLTPKEEENKSVFDARNLMVGTGPYYMSDYQRSSYFTLKRHETFYNKQYSFADQIDYPIISEYAQGLAQLKAGNLHTYAINQDDVVRLKQENPEMNLYVGAGVAGGAFIAQGNKLVFGWKTPALRDIRVRQAFSYSYDRDLWIDVWNSADKFEKLGLPIERRWFGNLPSIGDNYDGWRLEPRDAASFGPNAKYYKHDVAEAKKLLSAAGFPNGLELVSTQVAGTEYGVQFHDQVQSREGMNAEAGFKFKPNLVDYATVWVTQYRDSNGQWEGVGYRSGPPATSADPVGQYTFFYYSKAGGSFYGFDAGGSGDPKGDPFVDSTIVKAQQEIDTEKRRALLHELDRYLAEKMYAVNGLGGASSFAVAWPAVQNFNVWRGGGANSTRVQNQYWWVDESKPPYKKA